MLVREKALTAVRFLKRRLRLASERLGSARFSRPATDGLDTTLERHLPARPGFFVEVGAHDGFTASNTYFLERFRGWRGVLVEPIPSLYERCVRERPRSTVVNCALVGDGHTREVSMVYRGPRSRVAGHAVPAAPEYDFLDWERGFTVTVPARTLSSILDEAGATEIDLLVLDVEGYELEALRGLDLSRHAPALVLVETNEAASELEDVLGDGYELIELPTPADALYRRVDARP